MATKAERAQAKREEAERLHETIATKVADMVDGDGWRAWLDYVGQFHSYSFRNLLLIVAQCPHASQVAGFRAWQKMGRQVRKGEKSIRIFGFSSRKITETDEAGDEVERKIPTYPILSVFDVSQTDPIEGAQPVPELAHRLTGDDPAGIYQQVEQVLTAMGWTVTRVAIAGETNGLTYLDGSKRVEVDQSLAPAQAVKTLIHEAGHVLLHADLTDADRDELHRGVREVEAESVAYVLAGLLGLDTSDYSVGYIAGWADGDSEIITATAGRVLHAVHQLAEALDPESDAHPAAA